MTQCREPFLPLPPHRAAGQGSKVLLLRMANELQSRNIDGFFVRNQQIFAAGRDSAVELSRALRSASACDAGKLAAAVP